jgi:DNA polymerase-1
LCPKCGDEKIAHQRRCRHVDLHTRTAEDVDVPRNPLGKNLNFGSLYRIGPDRFCQYADLYDARGEARVEYARSVLQGWYKAYPAIEPFHIRVEDMLRSNGWIAYTLGKRRRRLDRERYKNEYRAITQGIQFAVSGTAQDILKKAMRDIWQEKWRRVRNSRPAERKLWMRYRFLLQVHDELILECPTELKEEGAEVMKTKMEGAATLRVPLPVDVKFGRCWDNIH